MGWRYTVVKAVPQSGNNSPTRTEIGELMPVGSVTLTEEYNREGECLFPVYPTQIPENIAELLRAENNGVMELAVSYNNRGVVWSGPLVGWQKQGKQLINLKFLSDLHYLDILHPGGRTVSTASGVNVFNLCNYLIHTSDGAQGPFGPAGNIVNTYTSWGIQPGTILHPSHPAVVVYPGHNGEPAIDVRNSKTVLRIIQDYADADPANRFDFRITRETATSNPVFYLGNNAATNNREFGEDKSDEIILSEDQLVDDIGVSVSFIPDNFCTTVVAVGRGTPGEVSQPERTINTNGSVGNPSDQDVDDGRVYHYAVADSATRQRYGHRMLAIPFPGVTDGVVDGTLAVDNAGTTDERSIKSYAEAWLAERTVEWVVPDDTFTMIAKQEPDDIGFDPYSVNVGDTIGLNIDGGFGRVSTRSARISKKVITIGRIAKIGLDFL